MDAATNLQNMKKLDDSWNGQDLQTFRKYHTKDCIVRWPNQPPTHGVDAHEQEAIAFFNLFYDLMGMLKQIGVIPAQAQKAA